MQPHYFLLLVCLALIKVMQKKPKVWGWFLALSQGKSFAFCIEGIAQLYSISYMNRELFYVTFASYVYWTFVPHD